MHNCSNIWKTYRSNLELKITSDWFIMRRNGDIHALLQTDICISYHITRLNDNELSYSFQFFFFKLKYSY